MYLFFFLPMEDNYIALDISKGISLFLVVTIKARNFELLLVASFGVWVTQFFLKIL